MTTLISALPASKSKNFFLRFIGHEISRSAKFGINLVIGETKLIIGSDAIVRNFNVFRNLTLELGDETIVGSWNWFSAAPSLKSNKQFEGKFSAGNSCGLNSRNYFDCSGGIHFGDFADLAGVRSTFITHYIDTHTNFRVCKSIIIGERVMLSSNIKIAPGAKVGEKSLIALGTVLIGKEYPAGVLIAGVPGIVKSIRKGLWFERNIGPVIIDSNEN